MSRFLHLLIFTLLAFARTDASNNFLATPQHPSTVPATAPAAIDDDVLPLRFIPPHLAASPDDLPAYPSLYSLNHSSSSGVHTFHTTQSTNTFTFELMTANAPWSARIQPAFLYQSKEITYRRWDNGLQVSTGDNWLLFFEGSLSFTAIFLNNTNSNENDVWASMDSGQTWDLIGGTTRYGTTFLHNAWGEQVNTFQARGGSNNCEDPASDDIYSIAGYRYYGVGNNRYTTSQVWHSTDAKRWVNEQRNVFSPTRYFSSCDVDINGHVYSMGGLHLLANQQEQLLNDVWHTAQGGWTLATAAALWSPRAEHLTLIASDTPLNKEIIYVIGGIISYTTTDTDTITYQSNDVYASSDQGITWWQITARAPFFVRWGHGGIVTKAGVILLFGGSNTDTGSYRDMYSYRDVWSSFDGGVNWHSCQLPSGDDSARQFIRTEQGVTIDAQGRMLIASGYSYDGAGRRFLYRDVWRTPFNVEDTDTLASMCGGPTVIPKAGVGLRRWRTEQPATSGNTFIMYPLTHRAPWSQRIQPAFLHMTTPITYTQVGSGLRRSTGPDWLLLYEGSLTYNTSNAYTNENDVWASLDMGATWDLIAGISRNGTRGYTAAVNASNSFSSRSGSNNCEDPVSDDVFSIGGISFVPGTTTYSATSNEVWYSTDAITWRLQTGRATQSFTPGRFFSSCDVDDHGVMYVMGGAVFGVNNRAHQLLNDVWQGRYKGREWVRVDDPDSEKWQPRAEHQVLHWHSPALNKDIIYVMGGMIKYDERDTSAAGTQTINDVWATSDGGVTWAQLAGPGIDSETTMWSKRWGHAAVITQAGVIVVSGGTDSATTKPENQVTKKDLWVSWDGGYTWQQCRLCTANQAQCNPDFIRTEQASQLTKDERLLLSTGYTHYNGSLRIGYSDVWQSAISLADHEALARVCGGNEYMPAAGPGLRRWPGQAAPGPTPITRSMSGAAIAGIVFAILIVVAVSGFCFSTYQKTGKFPLPSFLTGESSSSTGSSDGETSSTDYSAFAFASDNKDTPVSTNGSTNGTHATNGTNEHNSQFLS